LRKWGAGFVGIGGLGRVALIGVAMLSLMSAQAQAQAQAQRCWAPALVEAAQIKEFEIMLMVATLRCQARGTDLSTSYNRFIAAHRPALRAVGEEIVRALGRSHGGKAALRAYDRLGVLMANRYGNGIPGLECEDFRLMIAEAETTPQGRGGLVGLARRAGMDPTLPAPRCAPPATMAAAAP
jgi:hypothetical protein